MNEVKLMTRGGGLGKNGLVREDRESSLRRRQYMNGDLHDKKPVRSIDVKGMFSAEGTARAKKHPERRMRLGWVSITECLFGCWELQEQKAGSRRWPEMWAGG